MNKDILAVTLAGAFTFLATIGSAMILSLVLNVLGGWIMDKYQRARRIARQKREACRQRIITIIVTVMIAVTIFQFGYLCRQITHPERGLVVQVVDTNGNIIHTSEVRYDVQK